VEERKPVAPRRPSRTGAKKSAVSTEDV